MYVECPREYSFFGYIKNAVQAGSASGGGGGVAGVPGQSGAGGKPSGAPSLLCSNP